MYPYHRYFGLKAVPIWNPLGTWTLALRVLGKLGFRAWGLGFDLGLGRKSISNDWAPKPATFNRMLVAEPKANKPTAPTTWYMYMYVCMYAYMWVKSLCIDVYIHTCIRVCVLYMHACMRVCLCLCVYVCLLVFMYTSETCKQKKPTGASPPSFRHFRRELFGFSSCERWGGGLRAGLWHKVLRIWSWA